MDEPSEPAAPAEEIIRLKPHDGRKSDDASRPDEEVSARLELPPNQGGSLRTHEPGIADLVESDAVSVAEREDGWGNPDASRRSIAWGWIALAVLLPAGAVIWSLTKVQESHQRVDGMLQEVRTTQLTEEEENAKAAQLVTQIESSLRGFHAAKNVTEALPFVRHPERVQPLMEDWHTRHPWTMPKILRMRQFAPQTMGSRADFWLATLEMDDGESRHLIVDAADPRRPRIDWESLVCYQPMEWERFAEDRPVGKALDFRVHVEADHLFSHEFADASVWSCFRMTTRGPGPAVFGYAKTDSDVGRAILELLAANEGRRSSMILRLEIPENLKSPGGVIIHQLVNPSWMFLDPPDPGS
ncbi:MAG: hypothetical protein V4640_14770 [Verrucomicrobiota bacterium]